VRYARFVTTLRPELIRIVDELATASSTSKEVSLDALGDAIGTRPVSYVEIDAMISALEAKQRRVTATSDRRGEADLRVLLAAIKAFSAEFGRRPSLAELSERVELSSEQVKHALVLARVMQR
jgi:hypothetical protein